MARKPKAPAKAAAPKSPSPRTIPPATTGQEPALPFSIVCAGASAGGLAPLSELLRDLPADTGLAYVVIEHLDARHDSALAEILQRETRMPVREARDGMPVEPDAVYVIPPGQELTLDGTALRLSARNDRNGQHRPIDRFMLSLAEHQGERSIGIVLSGLASDGTRGLQAIKAAGGITFAQDHSAEQQSMPGSAIAAGCVDFVLPPARIAAELARICRHPFVSSGRVRATPKLADDGRALTKMFDLLRRAHGVDFTNYKRNTLHRRMTRRMVLHRLQGLAEYVERLQGDPAEVEALYQDILINVTSFFRDPDAYEVLKARVFPQLTEDKSRHEPIRAWSLGCSTGEEAYSIAMAYTEYSDSSGTRVPLQVFATDLNAASVDRARAGVYPRSVALDLPPDRLRRFFVEVDGHYRIIKPIRDMCVFARQNALADPPFSHMGLVACRNMLIYLEPVLQQRLIPMLHYALEPGGFLWLGSSETIGSYRDLFDIEDPQHKLYVRKSGMSRQRVALPLGSYARGALLAEFAAPRPRDRDASGDSQREADRMLLQRYSPPGVVVDAEANVLQFRGDTGAYLVPPPGRASYNLLKMLRDGLLTPVRGALRKALREQVAVREEGLRVRSGGGYREVNLVVMPMKGPSMPKGCALLLFEEPSRRAEGRARQAEAQARALQEKAGGNVDGRSADREVARLQEELNELREFLQSVTEEHETTTEELQSANEEVQSANEELQSANEELETSREEIQSSNEELATVNDELQRRNDDLQQANNDLVNLVGSVQMPIVILGPDLRIRRFTPSAEKILNLIPADVGRPLGDIRLKLAIPDLEAMLLDVIESVAVKELEVQDPQGRWFLLRIRPYKTLENKIDGAVLVLVDVDTIKRAEQDLRDSDRRKDDFLAMLSHELRTPLAALRSAAEVLAAPDVPPEGVAQARAVLERQTRNMSRMVDDLLDVARISHGTIQLRPVPVDVLAAVRHVVDGTQHDRAATGQKLTLSLPGKPLLVMADPVRLDQVLGNLVTNASKFTPREGQLWLTVQAEPAAPGAARHGHAVVRVRDNGIGIDRDALPRVFTMFREMGRAPAHARQGMGLGLTLSHTLVELMGGTIEARSDGPGQGSEFVVRLPLLPAAAAHAAPPRSPAAGTSRPRRILVIDDNVDATRVLRVLLELDGHSVEIAHDGEAALETARRFRPEVALLDLGMPGMDGYTVARGLRREPGLETLFIAAVTGHARDDDLRRTQEAGFDRHLTKPVERRTLQELLANLK